MMYGCDRNCPKRSPDCHSNCIEYLFGSAVNEINKEKIRKDKELTKAPIERCVKINQRFKKRDWRKKKMTPKERMLIDIPKEGNYIEILGHKIDGFDSFERFCEYLKKYAELEETVNRQQAEIFKLQAKNEALEMDNKQLDCDVFNALMNLEATQAEIEKLELLNASLTDSCDGYIKAVNIYRAEIERLKAKCENTQIGYNFAKDEIKNLKKDKYKLQKALNQSEDYRVIAKAEAVKEFAERLKEEINIRPTHSKEQNKFVFFLIDNLVKKWWVRVDEEM